MRGERLKRLRKQRGYTQYELAELLETSQSQIRRWESNEVIPSSESLGKIAKFFGVTSDYLLGLVDKPNGQITEADLSDDEQELISLIRSGMLPDALRVLSTMSGKDK